MLPTYYITYYLFFQKGGAFSIEWFSLLKWTQYDNSLPLYVCSDCAWGGQIKGLYLVSLSYLLQCIMFKLQVKIGFDFIDYKKK